MGICTVLQPPYDALSVVRNLDPCGSDCDIECQRGTVRLSVFASWNIYEMFETPPERCGSLCALFPEGRSGYRCRCKLRVNSPPVLAMSWCMFHIKSSMRRVFVKPTRRSPFDKSIFLFTTISCRVRLTIFAFSLHRTREFVVETTPSWFFRCKMAYNVLIMVRHTWNYLTIRRSTFNRFFSALVVCKWSNGRSHFVSTFFCMLLPSSQLNIH